MHEKQLINNIEIGTIGILIKNSLIEINQFINIIIGIIITNHSKTRIKTKNKTRFKIANRLCETMSPAIFKALNG